MGVETTIRRPVPVPNELTQPFWDATRERRLAVQRCSACGRYFHPPVPLCSSCHSPDLAWETVSGRGRVAVVTIVRASRVQGMEGQAFAILGVELEEQEGLVVVGNLVGAPIEGAHVGVPVTVTFEEIDGGFVLPQFEPAAGA